MTPRYRTPHFLAVAVAFLGLAGACSTDHSTGGSTPALPGQPGVFESDDPATNGASDDSASDAGGNLGTGGTGGSGGSSATGGGISTGNAGSAGSVSVANPPEASTDPDGTRAIQEADIVKIEDGRLYALSRYGGLSVIDVSVPDELTMLGNHKIVATPFEMYVQEGIVIALYNGYADYDYDSETGTWTYYQTSYIIALDARDPELIVEIGRFPIGGDISDSRIVGDILYAAAFENGYCWGCGTVPRTNVMSLDISNLTAIRKVDQLSFDERDSSYSWKRSLAATDERLFIAGPAWGPTEPEGSTIQVIDISDPGGDMVLGAEVPVAGQIDSRWQMDEYAGVLRVISQPFAWRVDRTPSVETFAIESSSSIVPLGSISMTLPQPERLQAVRFDGERAYAITFEQVDPLFTIDLSDPARPLQVGELVMPGWVYHMEPRGDRVLGLGFDQNNPEGALTVSLFDVSDLANPTMVSRVNFGGDWASVAEDQDRIHKAFKVLDEEALILVPFSGWSYATSGECGWGNYVSGVQLVDWADDTLVLRGAAPSTGQARRGLLHEGRLLTMSDERVQTFDISDRDKPEKSADLPIARLVMHTAETENGVIRVSHNWWTESAELDVTSVADIESPAAPAILELPDLDSNSCYSSSWLGEVYSNESNAYLLYSRYDYSSDTGTSRESVRVLTVDTSDPSAPAIAGHAEIAIPASYYYYYDYGYGLVSSGSATVNVGSTLVVSGRGQTWDSVTQSYDTSSSVYVVDLSEPASPRVTTATLPPFIAYTGLLASGSTIATSHHEPSTNGRVRFYLDRVDVSDPRAPVVLPKVNVPGSLVAYDDESSNAITTDYQEVRIERLTYQQCYERYGSAYFDSHGRNIEVTTEGTCVVTRQSLYLVHVENDAATVIDRVDLAPGERVASTSLGNDRLFVSVGTASYYYGYYDYYYGYTSWEDRPLPFIVLSGIRSGNFSAARIELSAGDTWGYVPLVASGTRAAVSTGFQGKLAVIDADDPEHPRVAREIDLHGYVQDLDVIGDHVVASLGYDGAQAISLAD